MKKAIICGVFLVILVIVPAGILPSCKHETLNLTQFETVCFEQEILPVFQNGCATTGCHSGQGEEMDLSGYETIMKGITPGSAAQSKIYQAITAKLIEPMPPGNALPEPDRIKIRIWIEQGALHTLCPDGEVEPLSMKGGSK